MSTLIIGSDNLVLELGNTENVVLATGTYTAGQVVVEGASNWSFTDITEGARSLVLLSDVDTAADGDRAIGAEGTFNGRVVTVANAGGIDVSLQAMLQKKNIVVKDTIAKA